MKHWTYQELVDQIPNDFAFGLSQGLSIYMAIAMVGDGDESDLVESFIRHSFSMQMFAEKLGFVGKESLEIYRSRLDERLAMAKSDLPESDFLSLKIEVEKTLKAAEMVPHRDHDWVGKNMLNEE